MKISWQKLLCWKASLWCFITNAQKGEMVGWLSKPLKWLWLWTTISIYCYGSQVWVNGWVSEILAPFYFQNMKSTFLLLLQFYLCRKTSGICFYCIGIILFLFMIQKCTVMFSVAEAMQAKNQKQKKPKPQNNTAFLSKMLCYYTGLLPPSYSHNNPWDWKNPRPWN